METRGEAAIGMALRTAAGAACTALVLIIGLWVATSARASFGELEQQGSFGPGAEQFEWPQDLAVDSANNNVFVLDAPGAVENGAGPSSFRIREFSGAKLGAAIATVTVPTPTVENQVQNIEGMAVDPKQGRLYVLKGANGPGGRFFATEIDAYSTEPTELPSGEKVLEPATGVPNQGKYYVFPHTPGGGASDELHEPRGLAVDLSSQHEHNLIVLGENGGSTELQRLEGADQGTLSPPPFVDESTPKLLTETGGQVYGLAVGPDGSIYFVSDGLPDGLHGVVRLSSNFQTAKIVRADEFLTHVPRLTGGDTTGNVVDFGPQVAIAPEGNLIYAAETDLEPNGLTPGSYEIRGMSTEEGPSLGSQVIVFGGGSGGHCEIGSSANAVAAGSKGVVYALDEGSFQSGGPTPYGFDLVKFGPGAPNGNGCPVPSATFTINSEPNSQKLTITKGEKAEFEASTAGLHGETPSELEWALEGNGKYSKTSGSDLKTSMWYSKPGKYDVSLKIVLEGGGNFGEPEPATGEIEVVEPLPTASFEPSVTVVKPGEAVTFDGSGSLDPTGLCVPAEEICKPTHELKQYTWTFGDGRSETTHTGTFSRTFENPSSEARSESVTLTVTNKENVQSSPATQAITILGTPGTTQPPPPPTTVQPSGPGPTVTGVVTTKVTQVTLTSKQKLIKALAACKKVKPKHRRTICEKQAQQRYAPKGTSHKHHKKKKK